MSETYRRRALFGVHLDAKRAATMRPGSCERADLSRFAMELLGECTAFRTIDDHSERVARARKLTPAEKVEIGRILGGLAAKGYLVSKSALLAQTSEAGAAPKATIDAVCVGTRDRPGGVQRCIRSYADNMRACGRAPRWTVLDSSPDPDASRRTREALEVVAREGIDVSCATAGHKTAFAEALAAEAHVDPAIVRFAFFGVEGLGHDTGANRNALLLAHAGELLLSVDDDTVCELRRSPRSRPDALELASFRTADVALFESVDAARAGLPMADESVLGVHEGLLGRALGECLRDWQPQQITADALLDDTLETLLGRRARVTATIGGFWGDCASTSSAFYLFCNGPPPAEFPADDTAYRKLVASRQVLRAPPCTTLTQNTSVIAANLGVDMRELAPPFFPTRRASDHVFGTLLGRCFEGHFFGFVPLAAGHLPFESRTANPDALWGTAKPKLANFVFNAIHLAPLDVAAPGAPRLRLLGRHLTELASLPWKDFEHLLLRRAWQDISGMIRMVQNRLTAADPTSPWARDARAYVDALSESLGDPNLVVPESLLENRALLEARALMQRLFGQFGQLLEAWPDLFSAAVRLRAREVPFAQPLHTSRA